MANKCPVHGHRKLMDDDYFANPYAAYERYATLHEQGTVHRTCLDDHGQVWLVTGHAEVYSALRDKRLARPREYSNGDFTSHRFPEGSATGTIVTLDPPEHTRLKKMINFTFLPRNLETFRPRVHELVAARLDAIEAAGGGDLVGDYAAILPITIVCDVLGIPDEYRKNLKEMADLAFGSDDETNAQVRSTMSKIMNEIRQQKTAEPGDDLFSYWIHARNADGEPELDPYQVMALALLTMLGGYDTTSGMISRGALALLDDPDTLERLRKDPDLFDEAVEELLRRNGSVHHGFRRFATEDMEIDGTKIGKGDTVLLHLTAAGNDPKRFPDPRVLDIDRVDKAHVAFGGGPHFCSGSELARMEVIIALRELFTRFPNIKLAVPPESLKVRHSPLVPALVSLPVTV
ncbi:cytochrome P450 [Micromonospora sp. C31]|uniref:cytochrome P450 n=1 Tax=Micromonospora sp. C31 TaxID=2824876 RepID=UPI001B394E63|nr:cytochrome P450 [Micromonospora sp. C31]MBQ1074753.1 cytochrome P450 [Micromonospora sp. C31]